MFHISIYYVLVAQLLFNSLTFIFGRVGIRSQAKQLYGSPRECHNKIDKHIVYTVLYVFNSNIRNSVI